MNSSTLLASGLAAGLLYDFAILLPLSYALSFPTRLSLHEDNPWYRHTAANDVVYVQGLAKTDGSGDSGGNWNQVHEDRDPCSAPMFYCRHPEEGRQDRAWNCDVKNHGDVSYCAR